MTLADTAFDSAQTSFGGNELAHKASLGKYILFGKSESPTAGKY